MNCTLFRNKKIPVKSSSFETPFFPQGSTRSKPFHTSLSALFLCVLKKWDTSRKELWYFTHNQIFDCGKWIPYQIWMLGGQGPQGCSVYEINWIISILFIMNEHKCYKLVCSETLWLKKYECARDPGAITQCFWAKLKAQIDFVSLLQRLRLCTCDLKIASSNQQHCRNCYS